MLLKRVFAVLAVLSLIAVSMVYAHAQSTAVVGIHNQMFYVRGQLEADEFAYNSSLTVALLPAQGVVTPDSLVYINETQINADGSYSLAFEVDEGVGTDTHRLVVNAGGQDATPTAYLAGTFEDNLDVNIVKTENGQFIKAYITVKNPYLMAQDYTMVAAAYGTDGTLLRIQTIDSHLDGADADDHPYLISMQSEDVGSVSILFLENMSNLRPLCKHFQVSEFPVESTLFYDRYEVEDCSYDAGYESKSKNAGRILMKTEVPGYFVIEDVDMQDIHSGFAAAGSIVGGKQLQIRLDSRDGELLGMMELENTGDAMAYSIVEFDIKRTEGIHDLYFVDDQNSAVYSVDFVVLTNDKTNAETRAGAPVYINNTDQEIHYTGDWSPAPANAFYQNGDATAAGVNARMQYEFYGTGIDVICDVTAADCVIDIYIDGILEQTQNLKNQKTDAPAYARTVFTKTGMERWKHTIEIVSRDAGFVFDAFKVYTRPIRVACVGDSITDGFRYDANTGAPERSWPHELNKMLGDGYLVFNCGHGGTTTGTYTNSDIHVFKTAKRIDADIVINTLGFNDYYDGDWNEPERVESFVQRYVSIMDQIGKTCTTPPRFYIGLTPFGTVLHEFSDTNGQQNGPARLRKLSVEKNWPVIDFHSYMKPYQDIPYYWDEPHFTHPDVIEAILMMAEAAKGQLPCSELTDAAALQAAIRSHEAQGQPGNYQ